MLVVKDVPLSHTKHRSMHLGILHRTPTDKQL